MREMIEDEPSTNHPRRRGRKRLLIVAGLGALLAGTTAVLSQHAGNFALTGRGVAVGDAALRPTGGLSFGYVDAPRRRSDGAPGLRWVDPAAAVPLGLRFRAVEPAPERRPPPPRLITGPAPAAAAGH